MPTKKPNELKKSESLPDLYAAAPDDIQDDLDADSYAVPRLALIEKMSPQVDEAEAEFMPDAKPGMIFNSVTNQLFPADTGLLVIPCFRQRVYVEWVPRSAGGGFVAVHDKVRGAELMLTTVRDADNNDVLPNGNELMDTFEFYVLAADPNTLDWEPAVISMSRTRAKEAKAWNYRINNRRINKVKVKPQAQVFEMLSAVRKGDQGNSYVWKAGDSVLVDVIEKDDPAALFRMAVDFGKAVSSGQRGTNYAEDGEAETDGVIEGDHEAF